MTFTQTQAWCIVGLLSALTVLATLVYWRAARAVEAQRSRSRASAEKQIYTAEEIATIARCSNVTIIFPDQA